MQKLHKETEAAILAWIRSQGGNHREVLKGRTESAEKEHEAGRYC